MSSPSFQFKSKCRSKQLLILILADLETIPSNWAYTDKKQCFKQNRVWKKTSSLCAKLVLFTVYLWIFTMNSGMTPTPDFTLGIETMLDVLRVSRIIVLIKETWVTTDIHHSHPPAVWTVKLCFSFFISSHLVEYTLTPMIQTYFYTSY